MTTPDTLAGTILETAPQRTARDAWLPRLLYRSGPTTAVVAWVGIYLALSALLRGVLLLVYRGEIHDALLQQLAAPLIGLGMDLVTLGYMLPPVVLWMVLMPRRWQASRWARVGRLGFFSLSLFGLLYIFATEFFFFDEFLARFNYIAVEYLISPQEVFGNIWEFYPVIPVLLACGALTLVFAWYLRAAVMAPPTAQWNGRARWLALGATLTLTAVGAQVGMSDTLWSRDRLLNEISNNGLFAFFYSFRTAGLDYNQYYLTLPKDAMWKAVHANLGPGAIHPHSTQRAVPGRPDAEPYNVVFIIEESLGSEFSETLGGWNPATPELDALMQRGLLFDNVFATGNRTIRGLEASLASLPPLPGRSIIKRDKSDNVETLARVLQRVGYQTAFVYGGRGLFDGMADFMLHNGFDRFIEQKDFPNETFHTAWGVSDEAIFDHALTLMDEQHAAGKPFFTTVLTVSNHKPYSYPEGRIEADPAEHTRLNAVRYADYALGRFLHQAETHPFYDRTLFVIFGDHGARVYGAELIPLPSYRVPLLMLGPPVEAGTRRSTLGSSLDITPTVLDLLGLPYESVFYGKSLVAEQPPYNFVLMQHNRNLAIYDGQQMVVLGLQKTSQAFTVGPDDTLTPMPTWDDTLLGLRDSAVAFFESAYQLYDQRRYRVKDG